MKIIAKIIWIYAIVLFGISLILYLLRAIVYPKHVRHQIRTGLIETSCLASISIAFTSITQFGILQYSTEGSIAFYVLWWIEAGLATTACFGIPYVQLKLQPPGISNVPPTILLPFIAALTSAAEGGVICTSDHINPRLQVPVIIVSYLEVGAGLALAAAFDALILYQHFDRSSPKSESVWQDMIVCGPFGQGSFALQGLGQAVLKGSFAAYNRGSFLTSSAAAPIGYVSQFMGLLAWGYGVFWWCFAIISICHTLGAQPGGWRKTQFSLTAWSLIFPWVCQHSTSVHQDKRSRLTREQGVFTNAALQFAKIMDSPAFAVVSTALTLILLVMWITVQAFTIKGIITGRVLGLEEGWKRRGLTHRGSSEIKDA